MTTIVLLPGMDGSGTLFEDFIAALGSKAVVVSYPHDTPLDYEALATFAERSLPANEPYLLLGESFSGPIAIHLASKRPPGLRALVLVCTFATLPPPRPPKTLHGLLASLPFWKLPFELAAPHLLGENRPKALDEKLMTAVKRVTAAVWRTRMRCVLCVDVTELAQRVSVPVLYLRATQDRIVPAAASDLILRACKEMQIVEIEGHHALLQTRASECAAAIAKFAADNGVAFARMSDLDARSTSDCASPTA
jgi:pimeloyl-ACP methyl ester carboxylesterase